MVDTARRDVLMGIAGQTFAEDRIMTESRQVAIDLSPGRRPMPITADQGVLADHRLIASLINREATAST